MRFWASGFWQPAAGICGDHGALRAALVFAGLAAAFPAAALFGDRVEIWAAENVTHDTNILRLSKTLSNTSVGVTQRGDTVYTTHVGINGTLRQGRQVLTAEYSWFRSKYRYFKDLDFSGHTARAHWAWVIEQDFSGTLGYLENEGLSSFNNIQKRAPDLVMARNFYWTGNWMMTPRYRATGAASATETRHTDPQRKVNNIDIDSFELGLAYVTPLDNSAGAFVRAEHGETPNPAEAGALAAANEYQQYGAGATVTWLPAGHSQLTGRAEWVRRDYEHAPQRDYRGPILKALYTWTPTPKFTLLASLSRDVGPADDIQTSFVLVTGGFIRPRWNVTEKISLLGNAEYNVWDYRGDPVLGGEFRHRVRTFGGRVDYRPTTKILLSAGVNREVRASDLPTGDYEVTVGFVEGRIGF